MRDIKVHVTRDYFWHGLGLYLVVDSYDDKGQLIRIMITEEGIQEVSTNQLDSYPRPIMLTGEAGQELMDKLYQIGIRPTEGAGTAGAMAQAQEHIKSLQEQIKNLWVLLNNKETKNDQT